MSDTTIKLFNPVHLPEMEAAALEVMRSGRIATGPKVYELEQAFASISGRKHIVATNDLNSAITLALHLAGVRAGDEVATIAFSCLQSNSPISRLGAHPVWIDIDPTTMSMSTKDLAAKFKPSIKAVMVYHVAGYPADSIRISAMCKDLGIPMIEDCNNAIGATLESQPIGVHGEYAVYSFYPNRQINGIDGGVLATPDTASAEHAKRLRRFGIDTKTFRDSRGEINPKSNIPEIGWSAALSNLNAAVALSQFTTLSSRIARTQANACHLSESLISLRRLKPVQPVAHAIPAFWGFLVLSEHRDELLKYLKAHHINSSFFHQRNDWYSGFGRSRAELPGTELAMNQLLALPCGWWLTNDQIDELIRRVSEFDAG